MELDLIQHLEARKINLDDLLLNPNNPRLMDKSRKSELSEDRISEDKIQEKILKDIRFEGIGDIYEKVKKLGFLPIDRIVVRELEGQDKFLVLEGNRRITTAKHLLAEHQDGIITLENRILDSLKEIEVLIYTGNDKNIIWLLQGMRHINGIKEWGALQQARFLYEMQQDNSLNATELDKMTGLGRNGIANKIRSYKGFSFSQNIYKGDLNENNFSLFQEAIFARPLIKNWLGWDDSLDEFEHIENLEKILEWYLGDDEGNKRFERVLDIRDHFNQLLLPENKNILVKFIEDQDFSINSAIQEVLNKDAEKHAQKNQLDIENRLEELEELYSSISTLPVRNIKTSEYKMKFVDVLKDINESAAFQISILENNETK